MTNDSLLAVKTDPGLSLDLTLKKPKYEINLSNTSPYVKLYFKTILGIN